MRRRFGFRGLAVVWAVLQFALPAAASIADAGLEIRSARGAQSHVESSSTASCRPEHPAACALCQFVSRAGAPAPGGAVPTIALSHARPQDAALVAWRTSSLGNYHPVRGPPAA
jgi:hypothetical protein